MIEAMEQQILNGIKGQFLKNKDLRRDADKEQISEALRVICSSRSSFYPILDKLKLNSNDIALKSFFKSKILDAYNWITADCIEEIIDSYKNPQVKDLKKKELYIAEVAEIKCQIKELTNEIIDLTFNKLCIFHQIV